MKNPKAQIYIAAHKPTDYGIWDNELYTPVQVGNNEDFLECRDNTGDNISQWNFLFAETTGLYWVWKNCHPQFIKGFCQYRRRLQFDGDMGGYNIIVATPLIVSGSVRKNYSVCHSAEDMDLVEKIIKELYPSFAGSFDNIINKGNYLFYANGCIMSTENFDRFCEWLFSILFRFMEIKGWTDPEQTKESIEKEIEEGRRSSVDGHVGAERKAGNGYQYQVLGFLTERLFTLWVLHSFPPKTIKIIPYTKFENI